MSQEVEIKIPITMEQFNYIQNVFYKKEKISQVQILTEPVFIIKSDEYFSKYESFQERRKSNEPRVIRLRTENINGKNKAYFCYKIKTVQNGIELNNENETFVENPDVIRDFFKTLEYVEYFNKKKESLGVECSFSSDKDIVFHFEIEKVNEFLYAEIEYTGKNLDSNMIVTKLEKLVQSFGLDSKKRDSRSWMEILNQIRK